MCCLSYPACKAHAPYCKYCHLRPVLLYHIFPHYLINGTIFGKTLLNTTYLLGWFSVRLLCEKFFILIRIELVATINVHRFLCKLSVILVIFNETWIFSKDFSKNPQIYNFMKIRPVGDELWLTCRQAWRSYSLFAVLRKRVEHNAAEHRHVLVVKSRITHIKMSIPNYVTGQHGSSATRVSTNPKETQLIFCSSLLRRRFSYSLSRTLNCISDTDMLPAVAVFKMPITVCRSKLTTIVWETGSSTMRFLADCNKYLLFIFICSLYKLCKMKPQWRYATSVGLPETHVISRNCLTGLTLIVLMWRIGWAHNNARK